MANKHVNAIVIGSGPGGGIAAKELSEAGLTVVLFERGKSQGFNDLKNDELVSQRTNALIAGYGPDNDRNVRLFKNEDGSWKKVLPNSWEYGNNAGCVGGGTLSFGAMAWRFMPQDFKMKTTYGPVEGSTLEDWPMTYEELEPYYEKAEWEIGVSGDDTGNPFAPPRKKPRPMPAFPYNNEARIIEQAAKKLGLHPFPIPMLRNSIAYNGRPACMHNRTCIGFACPIGAKSGSQNTVIPKALETGNCELRTGSVVSKIITNEKGRATGVEYFDKNNIQQTQTADLVIVSGSATETARLLLNSKSTLFPNGLGNRYDWVGRNLQGHAYTGAFGLFEDEVYDDVGPGACIAFSDFNHGNPGYIGGAVLCNEFIRMPYNFTSQRPPSSERWGKAHKEYQRKNFKRNVAVLGPIQEMPVFESRVEIDPDVKDFWGIPVLRISGHKHKNDIEVAKYVASKAEMVLKEAGAYKTWLAIPGNGVSGGQHQAGTCRMGNDPKTSVTNRYGQVHDIDNLFIADGSLHVTNGGFNPSLTIMAVSFWVSGYIKNEWKGTKFK